MRVLEEEQGSAAPSTIERALLDHAYTGHNGNVAPSTSEQQRWGSDEAAAPATRQHKQRPGIESRSPGQGPTTDPTSRNH